MANSPGMERFFSALKTACWCLPGFWGQRQKYHYCCHFIGNLCGKKFILYCFRQCNVQSGEGDVEFNKYCFSSASSWNFQRSRIIVPRSFNIWSWLSFAVQEGMSTKSKATQLFKQGMAQWWERSPPTNVARDQIPAWRHMWVEFVVGSLLCSERFFSRYSGFPLSSKTSIFQIPIRPGIR